MNKIKELRKENNLTLKELTLELNKKGLKINDGQLSKYERENQTPRNKDFWKIIAEYFGVSEAYLSGYSDDSQKLDWDSVVDYLTELSDFDYKKIIEVVDNKREE